MTGYWRRRVTLTTARNLPYYAIPGTLTLAARVEFGSTPLIQGSVFDWDQGDPEWEGNPKASGPEEWAPVGLALIAVRPPDAMGQRSLVIDGIAVTPVMTSDTDASGNPVYIDLGQEQFSAILDYIEHIAMFKTGGAEFAATMPLLKHFVEEAALVCSKVKATTLYRRVMGLDMDSQDNLKPWWSSKAAEPKVGVR